MNRTFLVNLIFLVGINLFIKSFYLFGIDRVVQNTVSSSEYGLFAVFFDLAFLLQLVNDFGIQHYNTRNIAQHNQLLEKYFPNILTLKALLAIAFAFLLGLIAILLGYAIEELQLLFWIGINQILVSLILYLRSNIAGLGFYRLDSILSVMDKFLMIFFCGALLWVPSSRAAFRIEWFVWTHTLALLLTAVVALIWIFRRIHRFKLSLRPELLLLIIKKSYPYSLIIFLMTIFSRTDTIMIERLLRDGEAEAAIYKSAFRLFDACNIIGLLFANLLLPMFARLLKDIDKLKDLIRFSLKIILAGAITGTVPVFFFKVPIMILLYRDGSAYSGEILGYLMISFLIMSSTYIYGTLLLANGSTLGLNRLFLLTACLNIVINFILIPGNRALGAAQATTFTQAIVLSGEIYLAYRLIKLDFIPQLILQVIAFTLLVIVLNFLISLMAIDWPVKFFAGLIAGLAASFLLRLINIRELFRMLRNKV